MVINNSRNDQSFCQDKFGINYFPVSSVSRSRTMIISGSRSKFGVNFNSWSGIWSKYYTKCCSQSRGKV